MKKLALVLVAPLALAMLAPAVRADRAYSLCDPFKSTLCQGLSDLWEFEEASATNTRSSELGPSYFTEVDTYSATRSSTHVTGSYSFEHTASATDLLERKSVVAPGGSFTINFWLRVHTLPSADTKKSRVISVRDANGNAQEPMVYLYRSGASAYLRFEVKQATDDTVTYVESSSALSADTWYMVTITERPDATSTYPYQWQIGIAINAGTAATASIHFPSRPAMGTITLGEWSSTSPYELCNWQMDQLATWSFPFAPSDATKLYNSGSGKAFPFVD